MAANFGSQLGALIAGSNPFAQIAGATAGATIANGLATLAGLPNSWLNSNGTMGGTNSFTSVLDTLGPNVGAKAYGELSSLLVAGAAQNLGLTGFAGQVFTATGNAIASQVLANFQNKANPDLYANIISLNVVQSVGELLGGNIGQQLGSGIVNIDNTGQALLASLGSSIGTDAGIAAGEGVAAGLTIAAAGTVGATFVATLGGLILPGVGALIGAALGEAAGAEIYNFLNDLTGGLLSDLFAPDTWEYLHVGLNTTTNELQLVDDASKGTTAAIRSATYSINNAFLSAFNNITSMIGGQIDPTSFNASPDALIAYIDDDSLWWSGSDFQVEFGNAYGGYVNADGDPTKLVRMATEYELYKTNFIGANPVMVRAFDDWKASIVNPESGADLPALMTDLQTAQDYSKYVSNPAPVNALIAAVPDSSFATGWISTFSEAEALNLNAPYQFIVTNTNNDGPGSLRWAIEDVNAMPGGGTIQFELPTSDAGYSATDGTWNFNCA